MNFIGLIWTKNNISFVKINIRRNFLIYNRLAIKSKYLKGATALEVKNSIGKWIFYNFDDIDEELKRNITEFLDVPIR